MGMESLCFDTVCALRLEGSGYARLSHRDFLGALMALGLKRSVIGDLCVADNTCTVFCESTAAAFIAEELKRAGRDTIRCTPFDAGLDFSPEREFREISVSVASVRLDGAVRALCNISREDACELVLQGHCEVNYFVQREPDRALREGDILSVRGHGKYIIDRIGDLTKRNRTRLVARKYV